MSYDVEEKVVRMQFDNTDFQPNIDASIRSLGELEKALRYADGTTANFSGTEKQFKNLDNTIGNTLISVEKLSQGFSAMGVAAVTVISDITRKIEGMGLNTLNSLFVTPIKAGFAKYGDQISSTQVIMNNTGETIDRVKSSLGELNEYANKTIYNFSQMTYAVGKFAAAGVNLDDATLAIQGLSNAAAMVGANNAQLYSAYYNLSQSMQMGYLKLIDWKSIANSMIGTKQMRKEFVKSAIELGKFTEDSEQAQEAFSNFEDSLRKKWLTSDIIVHTMKKYQDATTDVGKAATAAASELKSFAQMWDVISQTTQSSWAKTWEIIIGDLAGAKTVWTNIGNRVSAIMKAINDARNNFLASWNKDGRATQQILEGICNVLNNIRLVLEPTYNVLVNILNITADKMYAVTEFFNELTKSFELSEEAVDGFKMAITQIARPIAFIVKSVGILIHVLATFISLIGMVGNVIFMFLSNIDKMPELLTSIFGPNFANKIESINNIVWNLSRIFGALLEILLRVTFAVLPAVAPLLEAIGSLLLNILAIIGDVLDMLADSDLEWLDNLMASFVIVLRAISTVLAVIPNLLKSIFGGESGEALKVLLNDASQLLLILSKLLAVGITIGAKILTVLAPVLEKIGQLALAVADVVFGFLNGILNFDMSGISGVLDGVVKFILVLLSGFGKVIDMITSGISALITNVKQVSKISHDLGSSISSNINVHVNANAAVGKDSIDKLTDGIQNTIATNLSNTEQITSAVVTSIGEGMVKSVPEVQKSTKIVTDEIDKDISEVDSEKIGSNIISKVSKGLSKEAAKLKDNEIGKAITKELNDEFDAGDISTKLNDTLNSVIESLNNFKDEIGVVLAGINETVNNTPIAIQLNSAALSPFALFLDFVERHQDGFERVIKWTGIGVIALTGIIGLVVILYKLFDMLNYGKRLENAANNLSKLTDFTFNHSFKKETVVNAKTTVKTIKAYGKAILMVAAGLAVVIAAVGVVLKLAENYDLNDEGQQAKFWSIIATVNVIVQSIIGVMLILSAIARKTANVATTTTVDFNEAKFHIMDAFKSIKGGINDFTGSLVSLPSQLKKVENANPFKSMAKMISSIAVAFAAVFGGIAALLAVSALFDADGLAMRIDAIGKLMATLCATLIGVVFIISYYAKNLTGDQANNIKALGNAVAKIIGSLGSVVFALKFLFNDKKSFSIPDEYLALVSILCGNLLLILLIMMGTIKQLETNYKVDDKIFQDERLKHMSRGISLVILSFSTLIASLSLLKDTPVLSPNLTKMARNTFKAVIGLVLLLVFNIKKLDKTTTTGEGTNRIRNIDDRIIKLAASISGIIIAMSVLVASLRNLKDIGTVDDNLLYTFDVALLGTLALSLLAVGNIDSLFKSASSTLSTTKERANRILKLAAAIDMIIGGVVSIIISLRALNGLTVNEGVIGLVATTLGIATAMSAMLVVLTRVMKQVNFAEFAKNVFALGGVTAAIGILVNQLNKLNGVTVDESVYNLILTLSGISALLLIFITKIGGRSSQITEAMESIVALTALSGSLFVLALAVKKISDIVINPSAIIALTIAIAALGGLALLANVLGKGSYYVLIGAAAIIALTAAIVGCAEAVNLLGKADMDNIAKGLQSITNAIDQQGFKKMAQFIGFLWNLGFALMIAAPGIAIAGLAISGSLWILSKALPGLIEGVGKLTAVIIDFVSSIDKLSEESTFADKITANSEKLEKFAGIIATLGGGFIALGAGMAVTALGLVLINRQVLKFVAMAVALAVAFDVAALGIWLISKNVEGLNGVLDSLHDHIEDIVTIINAIGKQGFNGLLLGAGFALFGAGVLKLATSVKVLGQGILWLVAGVTAAIVVFKLLDNWLGGQLSNTLTTISEKIKDLFSSDKINETLTTMLKFAGTVFAIGLAVQTFGVGLILLGVGALAAAGGLAILSKVLEEYMWMDGDAVFNNLMSIAGGLAGLSAIMTFLSPVIIIGTVLILAMAGALAVLATSLKLFDTNTDYSILGDQLIYLSKGLTELVKASIWVTIFQKCITTLADILSTLSNESHKWVKLSDNLLMSFTNVGTGVENFSNGVYNGLTNISIGIDNLSSSILDAVLNVSTGISSIGAGIQGYFTNIGLGILSLAQSIGSGVTSIGSGIYTLAVDIGDGVVYIANSIMSSSQMIVTAADNISLAIDKVTNSIVNAKSALSGGFSIGGAFGSIFGGSTKSVDVDTQMTRSLGTASTSMAKVQEKYKNIGSWIPKSIAAGIKQSTPEASQESSTLANTVESIIRNIWQIHSASPLWEDIGGWISKSIGIGIERDADGAYQGLTFVEGGITDNLNKWTNGALSKTINGIGNTIGGLIDKVKNVKENGLSGLLGDFDLKKTLGIDTESFTDMFKGLADQLKIDTDSMANFANSLGDTSSAASTTKGTIESLTDTIKNQMNVFERFTADEEIMNPKELINNMKSQLRGVQNWSHGLDILTQRGISGPLLKHLSEMGPEGYKYVEAFLEMTESEFEEANELYTQSLDVPGNVANSIADDYRALGVEVVEAVKSGGASVAQAAGDAAEEATDKVNEISLHGVKTTVEDIIEVAKGAGPDAMMHYCTEANKWLNESEFQALAAQMQGKLTGVMHMNIGDAFKEFGVSFKRVYEKPLDNLSYELLKKDYGTETGTFYIDNMTKALTAQEYLDECNQRGQVINAYISDGLDAYNSAFNEGTTYTDSLAKGITSNKDKAEKAGDEVGAAAGEATGQSFIQTAGETITNWWNGLTEFFKGSANDIADGVTSATDKIKDKVANTHDMIREGQLKRGDKQWNSVLQNIKSNDIVKFMVDGVEMSSKAYAEKCNDVGRLIGAQIINGTRQELGIHSPSDAYEDVAKNSILGFVEGVTKYMGLADKASEELGDSTLTSLSDTIRAISSQFTDDMDTTPTIRPVLDLENVYSGMAELDTMFSTSQARIAGSAYMTTHDDSVERLEDAYRKAIMEGNMELANMLLNSENTNVTVEVHLDANAEGIFDLVKTENKKATERTGASPLMIARRNAINAGVLA